MIRELEYWQPIEAMAEEHRAWLQLEGQDLPPPEFAATLRALLGIGRCARVSAPPCRA